MTDDLPEPDSAQKQPTTGRFAPARRRDKILGVVIGMTLALTLIALAFWFLPNDYP